ncbi:hypothetical protein [Microbacterium sp. ZW T5_56]|uniref:hypothetical protein n=1 Tax=Microbacterium sp. ZW T5_56 TaxID=3378081 RepID=UPI0038536293
MIPDDWTEHRRAEDRELLGWIRPEGDAWVAVNLLGREVPGVVDWLDAEASLDAIGLSWLADKWVLDREDGRAWAVRLVEVAPERIVVKTDDFGAIDASVEVIVLEWPAPRTLRHPEPGEHAVSPWG